MKSNDFDKIASVYDRLARLVFGKSIVESQQFFLNKIPEGSRILILGGGSGWILAKLFEARPDVEVCYIEASKNMISLAKVRLENDQRVQFINGTEDDIPDQLFDIVITNFYLDLFDEQALKSVLQKIKTSLSSNVQWLVTDFVNQNWWQHLMLKLMYLFFKATTKIEANKLPDWNRAVTEVGGVKKNSKFFYRGFVETVVYQF